MKHAMRLLSVVAALIFWSSGVLAQQKHPDWYGEVGVGVTFQSETDMEQAGIPFSADYDTGFIVSGSLGRQSETVRLEGELVYFDSEFDSIEILGLSAPLDGDASFIGGLVNIYYDFETRSPWQPFIGAGAGYGTVSINDASALGVPFADDSDSVFTYQFKLGLAYRYNATTDLLISYRYLGTEDLEFTDAFGFPFSADGIANHSVQAGVRFRF